MKILTVLLNALDEKEEELDGIILGKSRSVSQKKMQRENITTRLA